MGKHRATSHRRRVGVVVAAVCVLGGGLTVAAATPKPTPSPAPCTSGLTTVASVSVATSRLLCSNGKVIYVPDAATPAPGPTITVTAAPLPAVTVTATPAPAPTVTVTQTVTPTATPTVAPTPTPTGEVFTCNLPSFGNCPAYHRADLIPMSNGYDTYVGNQNLGATGTQTLSANGPGDWQVVSNLSSCGGCVQTFPDVQQLTNDWTGTGWGSGNADTPVDSLSALTVNYNETSPANAADYEFAPDIWQENYAADVMFWVDTFGRCDTGAFGGTVLGDFTMDGQAWTAHRYGGPGAEIILVLDGPGGPGTCAQQSSGSIDIKGGLAWLSAGGFIPAHPVLTEINTGWEITQSTNATFKVNGYSIDAPVNGAP